MAIGAGWVDGAWVDAGWVTEAWKQTSEATVGGTSQLGALTSSGAVTLERVVGGSSQLESVTSSGVITLERILGGASQLNAFTSSGDIQVGDEVVAPSYGSGGYYKGSRRGQNTRTLKPLSEYEEEIRLILAKERAEALNKEKALKKQESKLEVKVLLADQQENIRQKQEAELKLIQVSESLLQIKKDLAVIDENRAKINLKARIMKDDDEVIMLLMSNGWL